jgi:IS605 OrfB family transposase
MKGGNMMITIQFKLNPTYEQAKLLHSSAKEYISLVNALTSQIISSEKALKLSSSGVSALLPSAVKNEAINAAKSIAAKYMRGICESIPILKKQVITWNNQNYRIEKDSLSIPLWIDEKSQRISIAGVITKYQLERLSGKLGSLRITQKSGKWIAQIAIHTEEESTCGDAVMGIDLGLKVPAVAVTESGKTKFFGNGRENKYKKRFYRSKRKKLGMAKKQSAIKKLNNKEQRWMRDKDHKISREIVNFAKENNVSIIRLEQLQNIRNTARTSRKNAKNLHTWSFYRLASYIEYKANMAGIKVVYVNPRYTSQVCPACGEKNKARDRGYKCTCGFKTHRDRVGAMNIIYAPISSGNSLIA